MSRQTKRIRRHVSFFSLLSRLAEQPNLLQKEWRKKKKKDNLAHEVNHTRLFLFRLGRLPLDL